jgi:hypothetical protein
MMQIEECRLKSSRDGLRDRVFFDALNRITGCE